MGNAVGMTPETLHELLLHEQNCYRGLCEAAKSGGGKALDEQRERALLRWEVVNALVVKAMEQVVDGETKCPQSASRS